MSKMISIRETTYKDLAQMGTLEDTFDSVISRLIENQKAVSAQDSFQGAKGQTAAATEPQRLFTGDRHG